MELSPHKKAEIRPRHSNEGVPDPKMEKKSRTTSWRRVVEVKGAISRRFLNRGFQVLKGRYNCKCMNN